jgi:acyl dehydratase
MTATYEIVKVGDELPVHTSKPIDRTTLALFAGASGDYNPIHIDLDFARKAGLNDVFAHGMLSMAYLAQILTKWVPQERIRHWSVRFTAITPLHAKVICTGKVIEKLKQNGENCVRLEINARTDQGLHTLAGEALIAFPQ